MGIGNKIMAGIAIAIAGMVVKRLMKNKKRDRPTWINDIAVNT